jgi:hypothetical protein
MVSDLKVEALGLEALVLGERNFQASYPSVHSS